MTPKVVRLAVILASAMLAWISRCGSVEQWDVHEIEFQAKQSYKNPFRDVALTAEFAHPASGTKLTVHGFHDGDGAGGQKGSVWKIRFMPTLVGMWNWRSSSAPHDEGLAGKSGSLTASPPGPGNHGPIGNAGPPYLHLPHADGHHTFLIGTWSIPMHFPEPQRKRFYDYFQENGMTRLRMWMGGQRPDGQENRHARFYRGDYWQYDLSLFRNVDETFRECQARGIFVDLMLFVNDMEKEMTQEQQEQYLCYLAARYGGFRALMVCVCNQTDWHFGGYRGSREQCKESVQWGNWAGSCFRRVNPFPTVLTTHDPGEEGPESPRSWYLSALDRWPYGDWADFMQRQMQSTALSAAMSLTDKEPRAEALNERGLARINQLILSLRGRYQKPVEVNEASFEYGDGIEKQLSWRALNRTGVRKAHWVITASGSFGTTCVVGCGEFMSGWDVHRLIERGTMAQLGIIARTMRQLPFWEMTPSNDLVSPLYRTIEGENWRTTFAIAKPGETYLVYLLNGGSGTIQLSPGAYDAMRLNPRNGSIENLGRVSGGAVEFVLPQQLPTDHNIADESDWVLIYRKSK